MHTTHSNTQYKNESSTVKWAQWDKNQSRELLGLFICVCSSLCTIVAHNTAQNRPDNFPSCPPDNHHCSDDVYLRERGVKIWRLCPEIMHEQSHLSTHYTFWHNTNRRSDINYSIIASLLQSMVHICVCIYCFIQVCYYTACLYKKIVMSVKMMPIVCKIFYLRLKTLSNRYLNMFLKTRLLHIKYKTTMWANAQRDGRPAEHR